MASSSLLTDPKAFSAILFEKMKLVNPGIAEMELYEFRYGLDTLAPKTGWDSVQIDNPVEIEHQLESKEIFSKVEIKPRRDGHIVLDEHIVSLTNQLFVGLASGFYPPDWVKRWFYFDIRGFYFLVRTNYFTTTIQSHFGGAPYRCFEPKQKFLEWRQDIGYKEFREANAEVDALFIDSVQKLVIKKGTPFLLAIAGPTAAGKTEIVERIKQSLSQSGLRSTSIEMDNFLTDRDQREARGIGSVGKEATHFELFKQALLDISQGKAVTTPRYDFIVATSSHDLNGNLKPGGRPVEVEPAEIVFIEGNFPFLLKETADLIHVKVVYLTDDAVRLKRKWKRDIDYRMKYDPSYLRNRFFKEQHVMAYKCYIPQMELADLVIDTTGASFWATPEIQEIL